MRTSLYAINKTQKNDRTEVGYLLDEDIFAGTHANGGTQAGYLRGRDVYQSTLGYAGRAVGYVHDSSVYSGGRNRGNLVG